MAYWNQSTADFSNLRPSQTPEQMGDLPEPEGFFESIPDALTAGAVNVGNAFWAGTFGTTAVAVDWVTSKLTGQLSTTEQDVVFGQIVDPGTRYANTLSQQERTFAGSLAFGVGKVLTEYAAGGAGVMATAEFSSRATSEVLAGKSAFDANMLALNQAAFAYAGAAIPGAFGGTIGMKVASGAGINVLTGIAQRSAEKGIYWAQGDERFANYTILDPTEIIVDAVLGAAFGAIEPTRGGKVIDRPNGRATDAAMAIDSMRFEDAQLGVKAPEIEVKADRGFREQITALQENRPFIPEALPDTVTMPDWIPDVKPSRDVVVPELDDVTTAIAKLGGLDRVQAEAQGIDPAYFNERRGLKYVFRKDGGATFDQMAERLDELGYPVRDAQGRYDANKVLEVVDRALRGETIMTHQGMDRANAIEGWRMMQEENARYAEQIAREDADLDALWNTKGTDISGKSEAEIAEAFGIKADHEFKAMQAEVDNFWRSQADMSQPVFEDIDPSTVAEIRAQAQAIEDAGGIVDDADYQAAADKVEQVKSIRDIIGCMLRLGV